MTKAERQRLEREFARLPRGSIVRRTIRGAERFYHQWRENGITTSRYLKAEEVTPLRALIARRAEIKRLLSGRTASVAIPAFKTDVATGRTLIELASGVEKFEKRDMFQSIMKYLRSDVADRVLVIAGLRRTGKTTMLRQAILALSSAERGKAAYAKMTEHDTMPALKADLKSLHDAGFRYVFIDEVTLMEDFIDTASVLSDIFAGMGMKIVLSGTDSLGFWFAERDELYDRAFTLHTTFIPFREHARLLGTDDVDEYIRLGGTLRAGELLFGHKDAKNDSASFRNDETTRFYIDTAIARNIQRSLRGVDAGRRFVLQTLMRDFKSADLKLASRNIARSSDPARQTDALLKADVLRVTKRLMDILDIRRTEDLRAGLTEGTISQIREYLQALDLIVSCPVEFIGVKGEHAERVLFSQPGMRFCQAQALVFSLMNDESIADIPARERRIVREAVLDDVRGRMLEDIVLLETIKAESDGDVSVFKLQFAAGEYDMVVADADSACCKLYEIKHSAEADENQLRHLTDESKLSATERRYGTITARTVLYRGKDFVHDSGITYRNVASYLKSL